MGQKYKTLLSPLRDFLAFATNMTTGNFRQVCIFRPYPAPSMIFCGIVILQLATSVTRRRDQYLQLLIY